MILVDLMRHGSTGRSGYLDGRTDPPLDAEGWEAFTRQTNGRDYERIVASPLQRAAEPADRLARERDVRLCLDKRWAEMDFGSVDGLSQSDIAKDASAARMLEAFWRDPAANPIAGGEPFAAFAARIGEAMGDLMAEGGNSPVLVVTHAGPMRMAIATASGISFERLWALRIAPGTRITLAAGRDGGGRFWGEIVEVVQP